ncbi:MAG: circadian clock KaiB family protein [Bacteroidota bacterium]
MAKKIAKIQTAKKNTGLAGGEKYILRLFVTGMLPNSLTAIVNARKICEKYLKGRYDLEIIDIYKQPGLAVRESIIAVPVLIKKFPFPEERMIGDLSDTKMVLKGLNIDA